MAFSFSKKKEFLFLLKEKLKEVTLKIGNLDQKVIKEALCSEVWNV